MTATPGPAPQPDRSEREDLLASNVRGVLGFFRSVIQSGEPWTAACDEAFQHAMDSLAANVTLPAELRRLAEAATSAPWEGTIVERRLQQGLGYANAAFIVAAVAYVRDLLAGVGFRPALDVMAENERLREALTDAVGLLIQPARSHDDIAWEYCRVCQYYFRETGHQTDCPVPTLQALAANPQAGG